MANQLNELLREVEELQAKIKEELKQKEKVLNYRLERGRVIFAKEVIRKHRRLMKRTLRQLLESTLLTFLTTPLIYSLLFPVLLLDLFVTLYQTVNFPVYGIPKVKRNDHIVIDRLRYLNHLERLNCAYCGYFNGVISFVREVAARTEQHWCPIKHTKLKVSPHSRYHLFLDYGDGQLYREQYEDIRKNFEKITS